ncbi:MAG: N-acetyltransferase [Rhodospirillales bacterium]|nr:N-acetyltransferase [Rhodospirillales bacterium]
MTDTVVDRPDRRQYELEVDGVVAFIEYEPGDGRVAATHTVVPEALGGRGVGSTLVRGMLDDPRAHGPKIEPRCPFVAAWIGKHPDYADLVAA